MSSPEKLPYHLDIPEELSELKVVEVIIPADPDEEWAAEVRENYCDGTYVTFIESESYLGQIFSYRGEPINEYHTYRWTEDDITQIDGTLSGVKMIMNGRGVLVPHIVLKHAHQKLQDFTVAEHPEREILIPISYTTPDLTLYQVPRS